MIEILNKERTDLSQDLYLMLASAFYMSQASQTIVMQAADALDRLDIRHTFFQEQKRYYTQAADYIGKAVAALDRAGGAVVLNLYDGEKKAKDGLTTRMVSECVQHSIDAVACAVLLYLSRSDGSENATRGLLKALYNFKQSNKNIHLDDVLDFFHFNKLIFDK